MIGLLTRSYRVCRAPWMLAVSCGLRISVHLCCPKSKTPGSSPGVDLAEKLRGRFRRYPRARAEELGSYVERSAKWDRILGGS